MTLYILYIKVNAQVVDFFNEKINQMFNNGETYQYGKNKPILHKFVTKQATKKLKKKVRKI